MKDREDDSAGVFSFFGGLDKLLNIVADAVENDKKEVNINGDIGSGGERKITGKYGLNIRLGPEALGGADRFRKFDDLFVIKDDLPKTTEPVTDVFEDDDGATVVLELPGVARSGIRMTLNDNVLTVAAEGSGISYLKKIRLKFSPEPGALKEDFNNSIYSVNIRRGA